MEVNDILHPLDEWVPENQEHNDITRPTNLTYQARDVLPLYVSKRQSVPTDLRGDTVKSGGSTGVGAVVTGLESRHSDRPSRPRYLFRQ